MNRLPQRSTSYRADRRDFLRAGATASAAVLLGRASLAADPSPRPTADTVLAGKDRRLIVYNSKLFEIETPLELLREHKQTPLDLMFVRNNQHPDWALTLKPVEPKNWTVEIAGLVEYPRAISWARLIELPRVEQEVVLQCSGNGRAQFSKTAFCKGSPWSHGAMANVTFRGVSVRSVIEALDVRPHPAAKFLTAEGQDSAPTTADADFEHSLPLADALDRSLLATHMNGQPLPAVHGGPLRLITPGYYGTMNVKWLSRLRFEAQESFNHHQVKRYRTPLRPLPPGSAFDYGLENSEPNWDMRIKNTIFAPLDGERVRAGRVTLRGVAWNDGRARIDAVEWSRDGGQHWQRAELERPKSPYAWHHWQTELMLEPGSHTLHTRAIDALGRTQPLDGAIDWNPAGYCWHGAHVITVVAT